MSAFVSTRNSKDVADARNAMIRGLSLDGGLYAPLTIPKIDYRELLGLSYSEIAKKIVNLWFDDLQTDDISSSCDEAYLEHFDTPEVAPVVKAGEPYIVELFHGETCAFKDVALSLLPRLLVRSLHSLQIDKKVMILTATSGDTGSAAMNGFRNVPGTGIITFFPHGGVSPLQRRQMVSMDGNNLTACAVRGNFDDCQSAVKQAFKTLPKLDSIDFSSANSINIARLVPQIVYYFTTYLDLVRKGELQDGEELHFVVPTGNFGDILAGYYAKCMRLPVGKLICASNANNVLTDFLTTGTYDRRRTFRKTLSPSMDILISSNLERLLYHLQDHDSDLVSFEMKELQTVGRYSVSDKTLLRIQQDFSAYCFDDLGTLDTIRSFYQETGYLADPHTAVALAAEQAFKAENPGVHCAVLATASPFKFVSGIAQALNLSKEQSVFDTARNISEHTHVPMPEYLSTLSDRKELHTDVIEKNEIIDYILTTYRKLV